jgi:hypothetical protein
MSREIDRALWEVGLGWGVPAVEAVVVGTAVGGVEGEKSQDVESVDGTGKGKDT